MDTNNNDRAKAIMLEAERMFQACLKVSLESKTTKDFADVKDVQNYDKFKAEGFMLFFIDEDGTVQSMVGGRLITPRALFQAGDQIYSAMTRLHAKGDLTVEAKRLRR